MLFNSFEFIVFLPVVTVLYFVLPARVKNLWLLVASYYFYMCWNAKYALLILTSTVITYLSGIIMEKIKNSDISDAEKIKKKKLTVTASFVTNLSILFFFKYFNFLMDSISAGFELINIQLNTPVFDVMLPVGISFYTFQALSYTMDVYRDEIYAEKNFVQYALFVSFFPQLVAGPIERSKNLLKQLAVPQKFNFDNFRDGVMLMLWGFFLKIVVADRAAVLVDTVYGNYSSFGGFYLVFATVLFAVQIYCDFFGYSTIAIGSAKILNINLMENFKSPYLSTSVTEFWRNWHISLTSWFKDYLYIPLGGSRKGTVRKHINKIIVFLVSGLWHGASFTFVIWGGLNGLYQVIGDVTKPLRNKVVDFFKINRNTFSYKLVQCIFTFLLIDFSWIFFRASTMEDAVNIIESIFSADNFGVLFDGSLYSCGLDANNLWLLAVCIVILMLCDYFKKKNIQIRFFIYRQNYLFRCLFVAVSILAILVLGMWGPTFDQSNFIYFQF